MAHASLALRHAWEATLADLDLMDGSVLICGPLADRIGDAVPIAIADEVASLVVLGDGPALPDDATVVATGMPDASIGDVFALAAWPDTSGIAGVVAEAKRIVRPGGSVWLGRRNVDAMVHSTPATLRSSMLYARHPDRVRALLATESVAPTELALVRGGFAEIESWDRSIPVGAFSDAASYRAAVEDGMWLGIDRLSESERSDILTTLDRDLREAEFPLVEFQPWTLARGVRR
jgi:hypothetical protein